MNDIAILVPSWDGYEDVWAPFFHYFFHYWEDCPFPLYLGTGELDFADERVRVLRLGADKGYAPNLRVMLERIPQEWVIVWTEDLLVSQPVSGEVVTRQIRDAIRLNVGHLRLATPPYSMSSLASLNGKPAAEGIWKLPRGCKYRVGITVALWKKKVLQQLLVHGGTAWNLEREGSFRSNSLEEEFYTVGLNKSALAVVNGIWRKQWSRPAQRLLKQHNLDEWLSRRPCQKSLGHLTRSIYILLRYAFFYARARLSANER